jgi:hypothetical protein
MNQFLASSIWLDVLASKVSRDETAMSSADAADVTAKKTKIRMATAPELPQRATAAYGATKPADTKLPYMRLVAGSIA